MKMLSDFTKDVRTPKPEPGSYEWWYFDAQSENGESIVVIFYEGNPFSRRYIREQKQDGNPLAAGFPAISISVCKKGIPVFYSFEEFRQEEAHFSSDRPSGQVGKNRFNGVETADGGITYRIELNQCVPNGDCISGTLIFSGAGIDDFTMQNETETEITSKRHSWNLVLPECEVSGSIQISGYLEEKISFQGKGYHDHNCGLEPMKDHFDEWYWGRYHSCDGAFVYYVMNVHGSWEKKGWLFHNNGSVSKISSNNIILKNKEISLFGLSVFRSMEFTGEDVNLFLQKDRIIDNGPFYCRFEGTLFVRQGNRISRGKGISEYIRPGRIYSRLFRPLVDMRIRYPGNTHWVQKSPLLYRWTW